MSPHTVSRRKIAAGKSGAQQQPTSALCRYLWPFWLFQDASRGDCYTRAAAYRHNREMRVYLPGYLRRWLVGSALTFGVARQLEALSSSHVAGTPDVFLVMAALIGVLFACEICLLLVSVYAYLYLSRHLY